VNETWISDLDRFSYQGLYSEDRLAKPMMRVDGELREVEWQQLLIEVAELLKGTDPARLGALVSPSATLEEMHLMKRLVTGLGSASIDHRLRQGDFRGEDAEPVLPWLGLRFEELERCDATLLVGSWLRKDQPLLNHRLRKSVLAGARVMDINPVDYSFNYELAERITCAPSAMVASLAGVAAALGAGTAGVEVSVTEAHQRMAGMLREAERPFLLLGSLAQMHPDFALLRALAGNIASAVDGRHGSVGEGANSTGARLAGLLPGDGGLHTAAMLEQGLDTLLLLNVEPEHDLADPAAMKALVGGARVVALTTHSSPWLEQHADYLLPIAGGAETSGTFVNLQGDVQSFRGVVRPVGASRPAWKVLRVLGNLTDLENFDYESSGEVRDELLEAVGEFRLDNTPGSQEAPAPRLQRSVLERIGGVPIHASDMLVRRARALQATPDAWRQGLRLHPDTAASLGLEEGGLALLQQDGASLEAPVALDARVEPGCVWLPTGIPGSERLGRGFGAVTVEKV
jgi:NADH-quinone oxidoreductase subunit G